VRVLTIVHQEDAGPGIFGRQAEAAGHELVRWMPSNGGPPDLDTVDAAMAFGGAMHPDQEDAHPWLQRDKQLIAELLERRVPTLGVCLGSELLAEVAGAPPRRSSRPEIGWYRIELSDDGGEDPLLGALPREFEGFGWHSYEWPLPPAGVALAQSDVCLQAFRLTDTPTWGIQFHAEVTREDLSSWLANYDSDKDAVRIGIDADRLMRESEERIRDWNEVGRGIADRFLAEVEARYSGVT
jgi:GMP synthase-like glutamine amidotransferase